ncbi:MAG: aminotransferase class I/II-fold pyridoxal phosphate-dependent enzyme [Lachnospiraceae bacterium]|nr:aminotransferase class I/II-fold pyridoxal phosphate-dependent enzyme [Lachnospiraceae bacterium]
MFIDRDSFTPFEKKVFLATPKMHGEELEYIKDAFDKNWITTAGDNVNELEKAAASYIGCKYAVALATGTASLHLAIKLAGERLYRGGRAGASLFGKKVFCSDMTFDATVNPVVYEGGTPVFIDTEYDTWNMDPVSLRKAFEIFTEVKLVVLANLYGTPAKLTEIRKICDEHGALLIEDAAESLGASLNGKMTGTFGDYNIISFNGNKIITGSAGGMLLTESLEDADKARKLSTQAREDAPWYQHEELGYNYRISNIIAGIVRGQFKHLDEHIAQKKAIYERYREGFKDLPVSMNPFDEKNSSPNYWLSCILIDKDAMCEQVRGEKKALYRPEKGKSCPTEILNTLSSLNAEGRPIWKPMHMQPIYRNSPFVNKDGWARAKSNAYIDEGQVSDVGMDIFDRGLCLPSDINMDPTDQEKVIEIVKSCFR